MAFLSRGKEGRVIYGDLYTVLKVGLLGQGVPSAFSLAPIGVLLLIHAPKGNNRTKKVARADGTVVKKACLGAVGVASVPLVGKDEAYEGAV